MLLVKESVCSLKEKKQYNIGFHTFNVPTSTNNRL